MEIRTWGLCQVPRLAFKQLYGLWTFNWNSVSVLNRISKEPKIPEQLRLPKALRWRSWFCCLQRWRRRRARWRSRWSGATSSWPTCARTSSTDKSPWAFQTDLFLKNLSARCTSPSPGFRPFLRGKCELRWSRMTTEDRRGCSAQGETRFVCFRRCSSFLWILFLEYSKTFFPQLWSFDPYWEKLT